MKKLFFGFLLMITTGCSALNGTTQPVKLTCIQEDTMIRVNGVKKTCPSVVDVRRDQPFTVEARKAGYAPATIQIGSHLGLMGKLDIVGTVVWFFPVFGLLMPGSCDLDQTEINIDLFQI